MMFSTRYKVLLPWYLSWMSTSCRIHAWQHWDYSSDTTDTWKVQWEREHGPGPRRGHSLVLYNKTAVILFGGRNKDVYRSHVPQTYNLVQENGVWKFKSYSEKPLLPQYNATLCTPTPTCFPLENSTMSNNNSTDFCSFSWDTQVSENMTFEQITSKENQCGFVRAMSLYNDVWMYDLNCSRQDDLACANSGWKVLHPDLISGCTNQKGFNVCTVPSERWNHGAAMINQTTMIVYGGYSHACDDYCDDVWFFDFNQLLWTSIYQSGTSNNDDHRHPGKRWKFSMVSGMDAVENTIIIVFGGHRLWHGFASDNSASNNWRSFDIFPHGGYLDDLWVLERNTTGFWEWNQQLRNYNNGNPICYTDAVKSPFNGNGCKLVDWPTARASHAAVFDEQRGGMWIHGGYSTYYPYPSSTSAGSGLGVKLLQGSGVKPYSPFSFFLDDLWFYDLRTRLWLRMNTAGSSKPSRRMDHVMVVSRNLLILYGGYADNFFHSDTWLFYIQNQTWLQKREYVHAKFPSTCVDDVSAIEGDNSCIHLNYPLPQIRANDSTYILHYQQIRPFDFQPGYTPKNDLPYYIGIVDNATILFEELKAQYLERIVHENMGQRLWLQSTISDGTPVAPNAATGPRQYAREYLFNFSNSITLIIWEWCTSVQGEPTRERPIDGLFGRSNSTIFIPQPRRLAPGWDGCREMEWLYPPSRSEHRGLYVSEFEIFFVFGGLGYDTNYFNDSHPETVPSNQMMKSMVLQDMWTLHIDRCMNNCSNHGVCSNGICNCDVGFYGIDCSNITCPGSFCYYDEFFIQRCTHCCYDGYIHKLDGSDLYISDARRFPCRPKFYDHRGIFTGSSNGICDGFGSCQCAPPFVGEDCSILDCKYNCSYNGYCSLEFPVSRCICTEGYFGEYCQFTQCLNNCTYPNGQCDYATGLCICYNIISLEVNWPWSHWEGEDCSYLPIWSAACEYNVPWLVGMISLPLMMLLILE